MSGKLDLRRRVFQAGGAVAEADEGSLAEALSRFVATFVGRPYRIGAATLEGPDGQETEEFACVVFTTERAQSAVPEEEPVPVASTAAVIDACGELTQEELRAGYARIASAKRLRQGREAANSTGQRDELLGVLLAQRSHLSLEDIATEMERLNEEIPATQWPDMVAVAGIGLVQYVVQFPGESISGDFFLPGETLSYAPPMYIVMVLKPAGDYTLNRMLSFVSTHLALFAPGADLTKPDAMVDGRSNTALTLTGYQCNLAGELVPVPREAYNDRYRAPMPFIIRDSSANVLGTAQYLTWQDGGVVLMRGQLPLEMLLAFFEPPPSKSAIVRRPEVQLSFALPITEDDFRRMLTRFDRQSNMVVRPDDGNWLVKKIFDEGTSSPFMARLLLGIMKLRDAALTDAEREGFDEVYETVTTPLVDARARVKNIAELWEDHAHRVQAGRIARVEGRTIQVVETIDHELGQQVDAFLSAATRAIKTGMQELASELGWDIGFLFQKQTKFEAGLSALGKQDAALAGYLRQTRDKWSEMLVEKRNVIEHEGWRLPDVGYRRIGGEVRPEEPHVESLPVTQFTAYILDRASCFVEEVSAHLLKQRLLQGLTITEVPLEMRTADAPERFRVTPTWGGLHPWSIEYHTSTFEET